MKTGVIERRTETDQDSGLTNVSRARLAGDYPELLKARLTLLVLLTTAVGYYLGAASPVNYVLFVHVVLGTAGAAAGAAALNQWWERKVDALMHRTRDRPVPGGRMRPVEALIVGGIIAGDPKAYSYLPNSLTKFPPAEPLKRMMIDAGYKNVYYKLMGLGVMAVHVGTV